MAFRLQNIRAQTAKLLSSEAVPNLNIKGNVFTVNDGQGNSQSVGKFEQGMMFVDVHIVDAAPGLSKTYYKEKYSDNEELQVAPTCYSDDGDRPSDACSEKQAEYCSGCEWNIWGSAMSDNGSKAKACRDSWKIAVIVSEFHDTMPLMLRVPPAYLKNWKEYCAQFAEFKDAEGNEQHPGFVITRVYFEAGVNGKLNFMPVDYATPVQMEHFTQLNETDACAHLISSAASAPGLPAPTQQKAKAIAAPKTQEIIPPKKPALVTKAQPVLVEVEDEDDEEAMLLAALAAKRAAKAAAIKSTGVAEASGQPKVNFKQAAKPAVTPMKKPVTPAGGMTLKGAGVQSAPAAKAPADIPDNSMPPELPAGIPDNSMPPELMAMLDSVMNA